MNEAAPFLAFIVACLTCGLTTCLWFVWAMAGADDGDDPWEQHARRLEKDGRSEERAGRMSTAEDFYSAAKRARKRGKRNETNGCSE